MLMDMTPWQGGPSQLERVGTWQAVSERPKEKGPGSDFWVLFEKLWI